MQSINTCRYGSCDGDARDANFVTRVDEDGTETVYGSIHIGADICKIFPNANGESRVTCTPEDNFPPEEHATLVAPTMYNSSSANPTERRRRLFGYQPKTTKTALRSPGAPVHRQLYDDSGTSIDIMVPWTVEAECKLSTWSAACTLSATTENNMRGLIDLAVMETNTAFALSGIATRLRLVHAYRDESYVEVAGTAGYSEALRYITYNSKAHAKRSLYGADLVALIVGKYWCSYLVALQNAPNRTVYTLTLVHRRVLLVTVGNPDLCGLAWSSYPRADRMFSVSNYDCATGYYTFGHEIGHNFGCNHDRGQTGTCGQVHNYNYGYRDPNAAFRTILAYDCKTGQCDAMPKNRCSKVQRFSNPTYLHEGRAVGSATEDNARVINERRALVASFYPAMNCDSHDECNDNDASTVDTCQFEKAVCVFTPIPPTAAPTKAPTRPPTKNPTPSPTESPTKGPTSTPTQLPTLLPTVAPSRAPTSKPTQSPTLLPTNAPSRAPTQKPTQSPTNVPTQVPTKAPTMSPTKLPSQRPTKAPTKPPTQKPTLEPSNAPVTRAPAQKPTKAPIARPKTRAPVTKQPRPTRAPKTQSPRQTRAPKTRAPIVRPTKRPTKRPTTRAPVFKKPPRRD